ncbi:hypothetical protein DRN67_03745 [Candidatus Micrarchaeota archaeon]|mgnify:CR=1 FL=1|nr:MAG: hypothetical protein DRN67_03745 [Candidatus Micrarchaeota archaeon]
MNNANFITLATIGLELIILIPSIVWARIRYNAFTYSFGEDELIIRDGIITRQRIVVPYERIQRVSTERTLRERLLSLANLRIETAARDAKRFSAVIPGIAYEERDRIIAEVMKHVVRKRDGAGLGMQESENNHVEENNVNGREYGLLLDELKRIRELLEKQERGSAKNEKVRKNLEEVGRLHSSLKKLIRKKKKKPD